MYYYYQDKKGCGRKVRKEAIEENVAEAVRAALSVEANREKIADLMCEFEDERDDTPQSAIIEGELKEITLAYDRIWKAIEQGIAPPGGKERVDELKAREELLQEELATAKAIEAVKLDRDRVLFMLESMAEIDDPKALIDVFVSKVVLTGDDDLHIFHYFDDNGGALSPGDDGGGGVLPNVNMLHQ